MILHNRWNRFVIDAFKRYHPVTHFQKASEKVGYKNINPFALCSITVDEIKIDVVGDSLECNNL